MSKKKYVYTGQSNLEVMQNARNYNRYLYGLVNKERKKFSKKRVRILDFGAGIGTYADIFKNHGVEVDCIEIDPNGVKVLTEKGYKVYKSSKDVKQKYDIVYSFNVLEHVDNDTALVAEMKHCINEEGSIVIFVPAFNIIFTKLDLLVEHLRRYRKSDLRRIGDENELFIKSLKYCDPVGFMLALVYRFAGGSGSLNAKTIWVFDRLFFPVSVVLETLFQHFFGKNVFAVYKKTSKGKV